MEEDWKAIRYVIKRGNKYLVRSDYNKDKNKHEWSKDINEAMVFKRYNEIPDFNFEIRNRRIKGAKQVEVEIKEL